MVHPSRVTCVAVLHSCVVLDVYLTFLGHIIIKHVHIVSFYFPPLNHNAQMNTIIIILFGQQERVHI